MPRRLKILPKRKPRRLKILNNYKTSVRGSTGRQVIRPQNNVPKQSVIGLRYKQTLDLENIPVYTAAGGVEQSGFQIVVNMSDPTTTGLIQTAFGTNTANGAFNKSNSSATGGQDNLTQALEDSGMFSKYDHFYVKRSVINVKIRAKPNQWKLGKWLQTQTDANNNNQKYLQDRYPTMDGDLYNFGCMVDRASVNLVDESVLKVRHQTAGIKLRKSTVYPHSAGKDANFKLVYTPKRLGIAQAADNRDLIGFTSQQNVSENSFAQFVVGKQMFPAAGIESANSIVDIAIDYEIVCCERRITDNDAVPRPLPGSQHRGDL